MCKLLPAHLRTKRNIKASLDICNLNLLIIHPCNTPVIKKNKKNKGNIWQEYLRLFMAALQRWCSLALPAITVCIHILCLSYCSLARDVAMPPSPPVSSCTSFQRILDSGAEKSDSSVCIPVDHRHRGPRASWS